MSRLILLCVACVAAAIVVGVALLALPGMEAPAAEKPVPVRYMPTAQLEAELAPKIAVVELDGIPCRVYESQPLRRYVLVCS